MPHVFVDQNRYQQAHIRFTSINRVIIRHRSRNQSGLTGFRIDLFDIDGRFSMITRSWPVLQPAAGFPRSEGFRRAHRYLD